VQRERASWIIVTYNDTNYVIQCVNSIRAFKENISDEIIIIDDGSAPDVKTKLSSYFGAAGCRYEYFNRQERPMLSYLRSVGRELSSCDWVIWLDNDVMLDNGLCQKDLVLKMQTLWGEIPNLGAVQPRRYTPRGDQGANRFDRNLTYVGSNGDGIAKAMYPDGCFWMSHRSTFDKWEFKSYLSCFEDSCVGLQMYREGLSVYCDNSFGVFHKVWSSGLWKYALEHNEFREMVISEYRDDIEKICCEFGT